MMRKSNFLIRFRVNLNADTGLLGYTRYTTVIRGFSTDTLRDQKLFDIYYVNTQQDDENEHVTLGEELYNKFINTEILQNLEVSSSTHINQDIIDICSPNELEDFLRFQERYQLSGQIVSPRDVYRWFQLPIRQINHSLFQMMPVKTHKDNNILKLMLALRSLQVSFSKGHMFASQRRVYANYLDVMILEIKTLIDMGLINDSDNQAIQEDEHRFLEFLDENKDNLNSVRASRARKNKYIELLTELRGFKESYLKLINDLSGEFSDKLNNIFEQIDNVFEYIFDLAGEKANPNDDDFIDDDFILDYRKALREVVSENVAAENVAAENVAAKNVAAKNVNDLLNCLAMYQFIIICIMLTVL